MTGLSHNFILQDGKFKFTTGLDKVRDDILFFIGHSGISKVYDPDYTTGLDSLVQKSSSYIKRFRTIILATLRTKISRYIPEIAVDGIDFILVLNSRLEWRVIIAYSYQGSSEEIAAVKFLV